VQDRYAFDAGDFVKLGLLRALIAGTGLRLGINWYLVPDEAHNADGKHVAYLRPNHARYRALAACDTTLMELFSTVDLTQRSVAALEGCGALPSGSLTYNERLRPSMTDDARRTWHADALRELASADMVFVDPDNGLTTKPRGSRSHKYVFPSELADYSARDQSLVVYHRADRTPGGIATQDPRRLDELSEATGVRAFGAVVTRLGSARFFLVVPAPSHRQAIANALATYVKRWDICAELMEYPTDA
jgi:hypothetical protein